MGMDVWMGKRSSPDSGHLMRTPHLYALCGPGDAPSILYRLALMVSVRLCLFPLLTAMCAVHATRVSACDPPLTRTTADVRLHPRSV